MVSVALKPLIEKLNKPSERSLEAAAGLCLSRTHYNIEIEHWLLKLLDDGQSDLAAIVRHFELDESALRGDLTRVIEGLKTGNSRPPAVAPGTVALIRSAWMLASVEFNASRVRSGHLLCALLADETLAMQAQAASEQFRKIQPATLLAELAEITADSAEAQSAAPSPDAPAGGAAAPASRGAGNALDSYTIDLTGAARAGGIDPLGGRDKEIRQLIDILTRRRQNNPILTGEAGVGKTAVAEGFALRIAAGDVPPPLKQVQLRVLDLGLLQAGAGIKGEFENRLKSVIEEVKASPVPIILFIDEAHTLIGAGGQAGQGDAANLLKPALARGELRTIAATTWAEYKKYFEKDAALSRRFQVIKVEEPPEASAIDMMRGLVDTLERHHSVRVLDEAVRDAVGLSHRYLSGRQLPDKAVSVLDTACARVGLSQNATPPAVEDCRRRIEQLSTAIGILEREQASGADHEQQLQSMAALRGNAEAELTTLQERWERETDLTGEIRELRRILEQPQNGAEDSADASDDAPEFRHDGPGKPGDVAVADAPPRQRQDLRPRLEQLRGELEELQGETPLVNECVDSQAVAEVIADWTGIPVGRMLRDEIQTVLSLKGRMEQRVVGQGHALEAISRRIQTARANLTDPKRPIGVFFLSGPSGVGKTETALTLAELLYGGEQNLTVINMSEFKEEHKVSLLMGSPPGYVGYGEGGVLTEAVRRRPYSVVLLDEMDKANPGVQDIFYQVFDKGVLRDGEGRDVDFKNTVILMASNAGSDLIMKLCADPETRPDSDGLSKTLYDELLKTFKPAFLGRVTLVPYYPLTDAVMRDICILQLERLAQRVREHYGAAFAWNPEVVDSVVGRCTEVESGARNVDHIVSGTLLPMLSSEFLSRMAEGKTVQEVAVTVSQDGQFACNIR